MKQRHTVMLLGVSLPICVILRTIQLFFTIDNTTGFKKQAYSTISTLITVVVCATIAAIAILSVVANQKKRINEASGWIGLVSIFTGLMFAHQTVVEAVELGKGSFVGVLLVFATLATSAVFIGYGVKGIFNIKFPLILLVMPVIYYIIKLISLFITTSALSLTTENVFLIFNYCALLLFVYESAGFENEIGDVKKRSKKLYAYGIAATMLCAVSALPQLALSVLGKVELSYDEISMLLLNVFVGVFVITYILCNFDDGSKIKKPSSKHSA